MNPVDPSAALAKTQGPAVLCILDGVGLATGMPGNALDLAHTPTLDRWFSDRSRWRALAAHGVAVGLPSDADMGNSEVGHNAMGAGRVFDQGAKLVDAALHSGAAFTTPEWSDLIHTRTLHLLGLLSDGNVHSNVAHLNLLVTRAAADGVRRLRVHVLTDGRDVAPRTALTWVEPLERLLAELSTDGRDYRIASGGGRMVLTMDRYNADWSMVERGWQTHVRGNGRMFNSASAAIRQLYAEDPSVDDQRLPGFVIGDAENNPVGRIVDDDGVLLFNFRGDRAIEISRAFEDSTLDTFDRGPLPDITFVGLMQYDGDAHIPSRFLVSPPAIDRTVGELLAAAGRRSYACSETQKFGHVTYFFNGNRSGRFSETLEKYEEIPSDTVPFNERPWMKCAEITDAVIVALQDRTFDHVRVNYPNGDMVGHTGDLTATALSLSCLDFQLARLEAAVIGVGGVLMVTADHGNADEMWMMKAGTVKLADDGTPLPKTSHTLNPVPFILAVPGDPGLEIDRAGDLGIASIGATILDLCDVPVPLSYAPTLIRRSPSA